MESKVIEIFYLADEFCKQYDKVIKNYSLSQSSNKKRRNKPSKMSHSEVMTILILFHLGGYKCLKHYYLRYVKKHMDSEFPVTVSYNRFVELQQKVAYPLTLLLQTCCLGKCTGVSFIDSTPLKVCHPKRELQNKTFKGIATKGKGTMGWYFGFKLHLVINDRGEILDFLFTQANVDDRTPLKYKNFHDKIFGKLIADKGYISKSLFEQLFIDGIHLITKIKKNMKNSLMDFNDKILLRKRGLIESVNDQLKNICQIEHTRHRSVNNFIVNLIAGLIAYSLLDKKPSLRVDEIIDNSIVKA